jgi:hypothetical protein
MLGWHCGRGLCDEPAVSDSRLCDGAHLRLPVLVTHGPDNDLDVVAEPGQKLNKKFHGEAPQRPVRSAETFGWSVPRLSAAATGVSPRCWISWLIW